MSLRNSSDFLLNFSGGELTGEAKPFYQFKSFQLDVIERQLLNGGASVSLEPKVFDVLVVLVERGGHLVKKDELLQLAWSDSFVEEANIARIIHTLRKVLGEDETGNKFIETVPKKGYRFVAEVKKVSESSAQNNHQNSAIPTAIPLENTPNCPIPVGKGNSLPTPKPKRMIYLILITAGFMSLALLGSLIFFNRQSNSSDKTREVKSIAVLPLKPVNTDTHDLIYELGIAESLIFKLSSVKTLKTRPLSATRKYSDIQQDVIAAGKEQSVDYVLASNYQIVDGKIRVTSQLINVQTGNAEEVLKSEKDLAGILTMEDEIASDIGNPILTWAGNSQNKPSAERGTSDEEAYRLYLQAGFILEDFDEPKIEKAIEYLEQAVKLDPNYAQAYTSLAHAYQFLPTRNQAEDNEHYLRSKEAIEKALALDENMAESHAVLGFIKVNHEGDFAGAEKEYKRAIELDPDSALAHELYAYYLIIPGRFDEALAEEKKGFEIDPRISC